MRNIKSYQKISFFFFFSIKMFLKIFHKLVALGHRLLFKKRKKKKREGFRGSLFLLIIVVVNYEMFTF